MSVFKSPIVGTWLTCEDYGALNAWPSLKRVQRGIACVGRGACQARADRDVAGGPDDVGNRNTLVPDAEKWGSRYEELVQLTKVLGS